QKLVLLTFIASLGVFIFGALTLDWEIDDLVGIFLIMGVIVAFIPRISINRFITLFIDGAKAITYGALVAGLARGVVIIMENGYILDTLVNVALSSLQSISLLIRGQLLIIINLLFNLLDTSATEQASIYMPVMVPIVDLLVLTRQT